MTSNGAGAYPSPVSAISGITGVMTTSHHTHHAGVPAAGSGGTGRSRSSSNSRNSNSLFLGNQLGLPGMGMMGGTFGSGGVDNMTFDFP